MSDVTTVEDGASLCWLLGLLGGMFGVGVAMVRGLGSETVIGWGILGTASGFVTGMLIYAFANFSEKRDDT